MTTIKDLLATVEEIDSTCLALDVSKVKLTQDAANLMVRKFVLGDRECRLKWFVKLFKHFCILFPHVLWQGLKICSVFLLRFFFPPLFNPELASDAFRCKTNVQGSKEHVKQFGDFPDLGKFSHL